MAEPNADNPSSVAAPAGPSVGPAVKPPEGEHASTQAPASAVPPTPAAHEGTAGEEEPGSEAPVDAGPQAAKMPEPSGESAEESLEESAAAEEEAAPLASEEAGGDVAAAGGSDAFDSSRVPKLTSVPVAAFSSVAPPAPVATEDLGAEAADSDSAGPVSSEQPAGAADVDANEVPSKPLQQLTISGAGANVLGVFGKHSLPPVVRSPSLGAGPFHRPLPMGSLPPPARLKGSDSKPGGADLGSWRATAGRSSRAAGVVASGASRSAGAFGVAHELGPDGRVPSIIPPTAGLASLASMPPSEAMRPPPAPVLGLSLAPPPNLVLGMEPHSPVSLIPATNLEAGLDDAIRWGIGPDAGDEEEGEEASDEDPEGEDAYGAGMAAHADGEASLEAAELGAGGPGAAARLSAAPPSPGRPTGDFGLVGPVTAELPTYRPLPGQGTGRGPFSTGDTVLRSVAPPPGLPDFDGLLQEELRELARVGGQLQSAAESADQGQEEDTGLLVMPTLESSELAEEGLVEERAAALGADAQALTEAEPSAGASYSEAPAREPSEPPPLPPAEEEATVPEGLQARAPVPTLPPYQPGSRRSLPPLELAGGDDHDEGRRPGALAFDNLGEAHTPGEGGQLDPSLSDLWGRDAEAAGAAATGEDGLPSDEDPDEDAPRLDGADATEADTDKDVDVLERPPVARLARQLHWVGRALMLGGLVGVLGGALLILLPQLDLGWVEFEPVEMELEPPAATAEQVRSGAVAQETFAPVGGPMPNLELAALERAMQEGADPPGQPGGPAGGARVPVEPFAPVTGGGARVPAEPSGRPAAAAGSARVPAAEPEDVDLEMWLLDTPKRKRQDAGVLNQRRGGGSAGLRVDPTAGVAGGGPRVPVEPASNSSAGEQKAPPSQPKPAARAVPEPRPQVTSIDLTDHRGAMRKADELMRQGEPGRAEQILRALLAERPRDHHIMEGVVEALLAQGRGAEGVNLARAMIRRRSRRASYRVLLGRTLVAAGDRNGARQAFAEALRLDPDNSWATRYLRAN